MQKNVARAALLAHAHERVGSLRFLSGTVERLRGVQKCVERISRDSLTSKNVKKSREVYDFEKPQNSGNRKPSFFGFSVTYSDYGVYLEVYSRVRICETRHISSVEI